MKAAIAIVFLGALSTMAPQPQDVAAKLSGTWILNLDLSTGFRAPGRRGGALFAVSGAPQRRGGGGGGAGTATDPSDLTPAERAERAAMRELEQIADRITIKASTDSVTFIDQRGERSYAIDGKTAKIDVGGSMVNAKSKWEKAALHQEFSNSQAKLVETWSVDEAGHLVLTAKVESMTVMTPDRKAVFDRQ